MVLSFEGLILLLICRDEVFCSLERVVADGALSLEVIDIVAVNLGVRRLIYLGLG